MTTDKIITDAEIAPAIPELNKWLKLTNPTYSGTYSAPNLVGQNRLIALLVAEMMAKGFRPSGVRKPGAATPVVITAAIEMLRSTSYPETGVFMPFGPGNLNDVPGGVLLNLIEQGATIDAPSLGGYTKADVDAAERRGWNECLDAMPERK